MLFSDGDMNATYTHKTLARQRIGWWSSSMWRLDSERLLNGNLFRGAI